MKLSALAIAFCFMMSTASSQVGLNIFGGPQMTSASYTAQSVKQETSFKFGFHLGAGLKVPFDKQLFFSPALFYSMKGYKVNYNRFIFPPGPEATDNNTTFHTVETAFLLQYDFSEETNHLFIKLGPTLDFQLMGKEKFNTASGLVDRKISFGYDKYGHYAANMLIQFGYEMESGIFIAGQYSHGLGNIINTDGGPRIRHKVFGITLGKFFGAKAVKFGE